MNKHSIVPGWVYNFRDYCQMFDLTDQELNKSILDYPGGIANFNAYMFAHGHKVISGDEMYGLDVAAMRQHADEVFAASMQHLREYAHRLVASDEGVLNDIFNDWQRSKDRFLRDYPQGLQQARYLKMSMPTLPFKDFEFDLALCSDFLFHTQAYRAATPEQIVTELCRVAHEVRVFPLLNEKGESPEALGPVLLTLQENDFGVEIREVPYEQHEGSNAMLRLWARKCVIDEA